MTIPTNLLQSQLALNQLTIRELHIQEKILTAYKLFGMLSKCKKQIAKYALLQVAIKQALREAAYNAKYFPVDCEDF